MHTEMEKEYEVRRQTYQTLSKREIDERIECVMREVAASFQEDGDSPAHEAGLLRPRWITPRILVDRMRRFIVYN